ncbi:MAG: glycosyltransferase family 2 protein [Proteobacteria bacterium]|nr:glycosyltransferase family 2 protein [Pseudomonadota bacterium]
MTDIAPGFTNVSVIVAAYQAADTIARTLASISGQTLKPKEVVVVDDGSTDGTFAAAELQAPNMNGIELRVFRTEENLGAGAARNRAIEEATGAYLAFLDADDEWLPKKLERSLTHLDGSDFILVAHDYVTGEGEAAQHHDCVSRFQETSDPFIGLYRKGYIPSCSVVAERHAVINAGGFDPALRNAQDFDLWLAMLRQPGTPFLVFGEPLLCYHVSASGIMSHTDRRLECCLKIARRYIPDLKQRSGAGVLDLWFRIAALHIEAICAFGKRRAIPGLLLTMVKLPISLLTMTIFYFVGSPQPRGHFLATDITLRDE